MTSVVEADGTIITIPDPEGDFFVRDGAGVRSARGYADRAAGPSSDREKALGNPFVANHYHEGYELGNTRSTMESVAV
jgi:hypothetical protein